VNEFIKVSEGKKKKSSSPKYWDGNAAKRILKILLDEFCPDRSIKMLSFASELKATELGQR